MEVALLPAFEFGVFCDGDCDYFAGPNFNFGGRVHTNGNLFLASGADLTFTDKIAAVGQVVTDPAREWLADRYGYGGNSIRAQRRGWLSRCSGDRTCRKLFSGSRWQLEWRISSPSGPRHLHGWLRRLSQRGLEGDFHHHLQQLHHQRTDRRD